MYPHSALRPQRLSQPRGSGCPRGGRNARSGKEHPARHNFAAGGSVIYKIPIALYPVRGGFAVHLNAVRFPQSAAFRSRERRYA